MCGLVGGVISSNQGFTNNEASALNELLLMDVVRGPDSTGVCLVTKDGNVKIAKKSIWSPAFMCSKAFVELEKLAIDKGKFFLGHNRKATVGNINSKNAHPFVINNEFVLMHNGSLSTHKHLGEAEVDSEAIAQYLHDKWKDEATPEEKAEVLSRIGGAWALVWYDMRTEKLNIVRNSQRPLFYASAFNNAFWCSDEHILRCVLERNYMKQFTVKSLPAYNLLTYDGKALQEVVLPTAPFSKPLPTTTTNNGGKETKVPSIEGDMSKNQFKQFLKNIVGKPIHFYVEDFVDVHGKTQWYGEKIEWNFSHELVGYTSDEISIDVMNNYMMARGTITHGRYDKESKHAIFTVKMEGSYVTETTSSH